jgi:hypothetical protein
MEAIMKKLFLTTAIIASLGIHCAYALTVDSTTGAGSNASNFNDPDDKIPFPHVADDGQPSNFQAQPVGNSGLSFSLSPAHEDTNAFQRAQDRMQQ